MSSSTATPTQEWQVGTECFAKWLDGNFYRSVIQHVDAVAQQYVVSFPDYHDEQHTVDGNSLAMEVGPSEMAPYAEHEDTAQQVVEATAHTGHPYAAPMTEKKDTTTQRRPSVSLNPNVHVALSQVPMHPYDIAPSPQSSSQQGEVEEEDDSGTHSIKLDSIHRLLPAHMRAVSDDRRDSIDPTEGNTAATKDYNAYIEKLKEVPPGMSSPPQQPPPAIAATVATTPEQPTPSLSPAPSRRTLIVKEILSTEETYVGNLHKLVTDIILRCTAPGEDDGMILSRNKQQQLFSNIQTVLNVNEMLLGSLRKRIGEWQDDQTIGDLFVEFAPYFKTYSNYVNNHMQAVKLLDKIMGSRGHAKFRELVATFERESGQNMSSFFIMPIQRIPRYKLLLQEVLKQTDESHPDVAGLNKALVLVNESANHINECLKRQQNVETIAQIQNSFSGNKVFLAPNRRFVRKGELTKKGTKKDQRYTFFLFNDLLVYASLASNMTLKALNSGKQYKFHRSIPIDKTFNLFDLEGDEAQPYRFLLVTDQKSFVVFSETQADKQAWLEAIRTCQDEEKTKIHQKKRRDRDAESDVVELPVEAFGLVSCQCCKASFQVTDKVIRCFCCNGLVCCSCSSQRMRESRMLQASPETPQLVSHKSMPLSSEINGTSGDATESTPEDEGTTRPICVECVRLVRDKKRHQRKSSIELVENIAAVNKAVGPKKRGELTLKGSRFSKLSQMASQAHQYEVDVASISVLGDGSEGTKNTRKPVANGTLDVNALQAALVRRRIKTISKEQDATQKEVEADAKIDPALSAAAATSSGGFHDEVRKRVEARKSFTISAAALGSHSRSSSKKMPPPLPQEFLKQRQRQVSVPVRGGNDHPAEASGAKTPPSKLNMIKEQIRRNREKNNTLKRDEPSQQPPQQQSVPPPVPPMPDSVPAVSSSTPTHAAKLPASVFSHLSHRPRDKEDPLMMLLRRCFSWQEKNVISATRSLFTGVTLRTPMGALETGTRCTSIDVNFETCEFTIIDDERNLRVQGTFGLTFSTS